MAAELDAPLFGVVGSPIGHSRSPILHEAAYAAIGFRARYDRTEVRSGGLAAFLAASGVERSGLSVTMPLKREAWEIALERDRAATLTGSVNTLVRRPGGGFDGSNTDVGGIIDAVRSADTRPARTVLVLGAGATAASAVVAAAELGATLVVLAARSPERAAGTADIAGSLGLEIRVVPLDAVSDVDADVVLATLPGGTTLDALPERAARGGAVLLDAAYDPWPSAIAAHWLAAGAPVVHGLAMLVHQAARQVRLFAGIDEARWGELRPVVLDAMFARLDGAVARTR